jgi:archaellum biogenesis protein FlaJ (TadC family)
MTRREHLDWCIKRAIQEMDFSKKPSQGLVSMASDLRKHPETNSEALISLTMMQAVINPNITRQQVINFLEGFN